VYNDNPIIITFVLLMETKTARLTILIDPVKKKAFDELCQAQDLTPSQVIRQMIREYLDRHDVGYATKSKVGTAPSRNGNKA
jgi:predicted transcriptional regulator